MPMPTTDWFGARRSTYKDLLSSGESIPDFMSACPEGPIITRC
jgi:hypothetical protein